MTDAPMILWAEEGTKDREKEKAPDREKEKAPEGVGTGNDGSSKLLVSISLFINLSHTYTKVESLFF